MMVERTFKNCFIRLSSVGTWVNPIRSLHCACSRSQRQDNRKFQYRSFSQVPVTPFPRPQCIPT